MANGNKKVDETARLIRSLVRSDHFAEAAELCRQNIDSWPQSIKDQAWHDLAYVLWCCGSKPEAIEAISTAVALRPADAAHRDARARWSLELRDYNTTIEDCGALLEIEKRRGSEAFVDAAHVLRSFALVGLDRLPEAREDILSVKGRGPFRIWKTDWTKSELVKLME